MKKMTVIVVLFFLGRYSSAQEAKASFWLDFEQLEDSLKVNPKPVFLYFHTEWCAYCRKMEAEVFSKPFIASLLSDKYYAVKFDAEYPDDVFFDGRIFSNKQLKASRTPLHDLAILFNGQTDSFAPPLILLFDEKFFLKKRVNSYLDSKSLNLLLDEGL
jgi:thioredoxin-related protein